MPTDICAAVARRTGGNAEQIGSVVHLLDAGLNPVFIAHYRKAEVGGLDEAAIRSIARACRAARRVEAARRDARAAIEAAGAMTPQVEEVLAAASRADVLEDLAAPYRPGRRTAASVAVERGLGPLADYVLEGPAEGPDLETKAAEFVGPDRDVHDPGDALAGAGHIIADRASADPRLRQRARRTVWEHGKLRAVKSRSAGKGSAEFRGYFDFREALQHIPPHRVLAINRGERSKALKVTVEVPREALLEQVLPLVAPPDHRFREFARAAVEDALDRLVIPALDREARRRITEQAEDHAIEVFAENLRSLLMAPPQQEMRVLALQPGFRTGCKIAILDAEGGLLAETIVYPFEPQKKRDEAKTAMLTETRRHGVQTVAIGNGTGCRDCEELVSELIEENRLEVVYTIVNEAGASVYADSDLAKQEFPNLEAAVRATVSIGRRLQDPLAELVKIDPRAIGVGLYQHDVDQDKLREELEATVQSCVCAVGVDANSASAAMLRHIPALDEAKAAALLARRAEAHLRSREELRHLPGWDGDTFLQAAGFLRVRGPNPLDDTPIHPERYELAERVLRQVGRTSRDLAEHDARRAVEAALTGIGLEPLAEELGVPMATLIEVVAALQHPQRDPRDSHSGPVWRKRIQRIEDLKPGMWVKGTVRNVVDFGAFVDVGLKEDGLIHISQFSRRYVRNPLKFLHVGDVVDARIVSLDPARHRIALTLIPEGKGRKAAGRRQRRRSADRATKPKDPPAEASPPADRSRPAGPEPAAAGPPPERPTSRDAGRSRSPRRSRARDTSSKGRKGRPRQPRRDRRGGPPKPKQPRVHTFRDEPSRKPAEEKDLDEKGLPKIRWAWYDSDEEPPEEPEEES